MTYTTEMKYDDQSIRRLVRVQYNAYALAFRLGMLLAAVVLIVLALFGGMGDAPMALTLMLGCWLAASAQFPAKRLGNQMVKQMAGHYPSPVYRIGEADMLVTEAGEERTLRYGQVDRLLEDEGYFYLFLNRQAGLMLPKNSLQPSDPAGLRALLERKTAQSFEKATPLLILNLYTAYRRWQQSRERNGRTIGHA